MTAKKVNAFFADPKVQEALKEHPAMKSAEDAVKAFAATAQKLGFDLTAKDFEEALPKMEQELKGRTDDAVRAVGKLDDEDLDQVAGGGCYVYSSYGCIQTTCDLELIIDPWCKDQLLHKID